MSCTFTFFVGGYVSTIPRKLTILQKLGLLGLTFVTTAVGIGIFFLVKEQVAVVGFKDPGVWVFVAITGIPLVFGYFQIWRIRQAIRYEPVDAEWRP